MFLRREISALVAVGSLLALTATAVAETRAQERFIVGGFVDVSRPPTYIFKPHALPLPLPRAGAARRNEAANWRAVQDIGSYTDRYPETLAMLLIDRGKVVHTEYRGAAIRPTASE